MDDKQRELVSAEEIKLRAKIEKFFVIGGNILLGKEEKLKLVLCCLLADGHLLLEDIPGVGKTTLVHFLGNIFGLKFSRIQFTNDLLPSDILGVSLFDQKNQEFVFHQGPIFGQLILADELNRASPKTQSALLEVMEERKVTLDGKVYRMDDFFMVVATQNPHEHIGTFPLPESQLDRFLMSMELGHPTPLAEKRLLQEGPRKKMVADLEALFSLGEIMMLKKLVEATLLPDCIVDYIQQILSSSRKQNFGNMGLSPRAGLGLVAASKAWAYLEGRNHVIHEDVQKVALNVMGHRLGLGQKLRHQEGQEIGEKILKSIEIY